MLVAVRDSFDRVFCGGWCTRWEPTEEQRQHWPPRHSGAQCPRGAVAALPSGHWEPACHRTISTHGKLPLPVSPALPFSTHADFLRRLFLAILATAHHPAPAVGHLPPFCCAPLGRRLSGQPPPAAAVGVRAVPAGGEPPAARSGQAAARGVRRHARACSLEQCCIPPLVGPLLQQEVLSGCMPTTPRQTV